MPHTDMLPKRDVLEMRKGQLDKEFSTFQAHYKDLAEHIQPRRGRFLLNERNKGDKKHSAIINSEGTRALRIATAGLQAGVVSAARPWFSFRTEDRDLMEFQPVKQYLQQSAQVIRDILNNSNFYSQTPTMLAEMLLFGTGAMSHVADTLDVARFYTHTVGSYRLIQDHRRVIVGMVREYEMTVMQLVARFGLDNCSISVNEAWDRGNYESWYPVVHFIEPNPNHDPRRMHSSFKKWRSYYYERDNVDREQWLSSMGFDEFPVYAPRWETTNEDVYGTYCPGMVALGDVKQLQMQERRKAQAIDKMVNPPLKGPPSLRNTTVNTLPGGVNIFSSSGSSDTLGPLYEVRPQLGDLREDMSSVERRINDAFYTDLFLAITDMEGIQPRNQMEIVQRNEERLLQLGPVLERIQGEFLRLLIDRQWNQAEARGLLPEPPEELSGQNLNIQYVSSLAMAQRAVATNSIDRIAGFVGGLFDMGYSNILDKFDADQAVDEYASAIGADADLIVPDDQVQRVREERAQMEQAQQQLATMQQGADVAQTLSDTTNSDGQNVLEQLTG